MQCNGLVPALYWWVASYYGSKLAWFHTVCFWTNPKLGEHQNRHNIRSSDYCFVFVLCLTIPFLLIWFIIDNPSYFQYGDQHALNSNLLETYADLICVPSLFCRLPRSKGQLLWKQSTSVAWLLSWSNMPPLMFFAWIFYNQWIILSVLSHWTVKKTIMVSSWIKLSGRRYL